MRTQTVSAPARLRNRQVIQNSWVVHDIDAAVWQWVRTTGVGPFFVIKASRSMTSATGADPRRSRSR